MILAIGVFSEESELTLEVVDVAVLCLQGVEGTVQALPPAFLDGALAVEPRQQTLQARQVGGIGRWRLLGRMDAAATWRGHV
jgi:hypothetical protein